MLKSGKARHSIRVKSENLQEFWVVSLQAVLRAVLGLLRVHGNLERSSSQYVRNKQLSMEMWVCFSMFWFASSFRRIGN